MLVCLGNVIRNLRCDEIRGSPTLFGRDAAGQIRSGGSSLERNRCGYSDRVGRRQRRYYRAIWSSAIWSSGLEAWKRNRKRRCLRASWASGNAVTGESLLRIGYEHLGQRDGRHGRQRSSSHLLSRWRRRRQKRRRGNWWRMHRSLTRRTTRGRGLRVRIGLDSGLVWSLALLGHRLMLLDQQKTDDCSYKPGKGAESLSSLVDWIRRSTRGRWLGCHGTAVRR